MRYNADMEAWLDEARRAECFTVLNALRPHGLKGNRRQVEGPCPACGGTDRFSINLVKNLFHCRVSKTGGDAIAMVMYLDGVDFLRACETINGRPPPEGKSGQVADTTKIKQQQEANAASAKKRLDDGNDFRRREIARARKIWDGAGPVQHSIAEAYLRFRGVEPSATAKLRAYEKLPYWAEIKGQWQVIHESPAMVAAIQGRDERFIGCHITYIDGGLTTASGKAEIIHPVTGEVLDAKKVRGSQKGGHIYLGGPHEARHLVMGEGIETVYSVREKLRERADVLFWSAVNLGNIGGRAASRVFHPTATRSDKNGKVTRLKVMSAEPDLEDHDTVWPPEQVLNILLLGDGDSDRFNTRNTLQRGATRWAKPSRITKAAWAADGLDFNSMLRTGTAPQVAA